MPLRSLYEALARRNTELIGKYRDKAAGKNVITNIPTGLPSLDAYGLGEPGILTVIQGHPGDGKTSVVRQLLRGAAEAGFKPQAYIFEDPEKFFADGFTAKEMGVSSFKLRRYELEPALAEAQIIAATKAMQWSKDVLFQTEKMDTDKLYEQLMDTIVAKTGAVFVDYLQAFDEEAGEKSVERVIARLCWQMMNVAKAKDVAIYCFSQPRGEVEIRGRQRYDNWMWRLNRQVEKREGDEEPEIKTADLLQAVEGYRPGPGDSQWSRAISQRAKDIISIFRPGKWIKLLGHDVEDNLFEIKRVKGNYSPSQEPLRFKWVGETQSIQEGKKKDGKKA